jgi:F-type H+-transporting ATPase subunit b
MRLISAGKIVGILFALLFLAAIASSAQTQEASSPPSSPKQQSAQPSEPELKQSPQGPGRQLVHESNEAAGEGKDAMEQFKQSPAVLLISRLTGLSPQRSYWLSMVSNFLVIAVVVVWAARKYMPGIFRDRTAAIQRAIREAQQASEEARRKLADIESRLVKLDAEISTMREAAEKEAAAEVSRIQAAAQDDARKIVAAAEQEIAAAAKAARRQLTAHAADLAVALAQRQIRVDAATDQALVRNFAGQLSAAQNNPGKDGH